MVELSEEEARRFLERNPGIREIERKWHALTQIHRHRDEFNRLLGEELERHEKPGDRPPGEEPGTA